MLDLRNAVRGLRATPVVSVVVVLSLALGIGANTAIFSLFDSLLLRTLPVREPDRLFVLDGEMTNPIWEQLRARPDLSAGAMAWSRTRFNVSDRGEAAFVDGIWASGGFFDVLGVPAVLGRTFTPQDDARGGGPDGAVAVIGYGFWQRHFGGAPDVIGRALTIERVPYTVVGVTPAGFLGPDVGLAYDVAIPIGTDPLVRGADSRLDGRSTWWLDVMLRLKPGQSPEAATARLRGLQPAIRKATLPLNWAASELRQYLSDPFVLEPAARGLSDLRGRYQRPLQSLMVSVAVVLFSACVYIANLLFARTSGRRREFAVRLALGASRLRLARQLIVESLLLSGLGALAGLLFAHWGSRLLVAELSTAASPVVLPLSIDWRILGFTALVAISTAILFGTAPAFRAARVHANETMKEHGRRVAGEGRLTFGHALIVLQVALSLVLMVAAGLFVRTFASLATRDLGFDRDRVLIVEVNALRSRTGPAGRLALYERIREAAAAVPGVSAAATSRITPLSGAGWNGFVEVPGGPVFTGRDRLIWFNAIDSGWFKTYGTRLIAGRDFTTRDVAGAPDVAIVNDAFVRRRMPGVDPIGRYADDIWTTTRRYKIVGVVRDAVYRSVRDAAPPTIYLPIAQQDPRSAISLSVRAVAGPPSALTRAIASAIAAVDGDVTLTFIPVAEQINATLVRERIVAMLSGFFGALTVLLAGIGLYGMTSYSVGRRRAEMGIRLALGAEPSRVVALVLRRVALLVACGITVGAGASLWAGQFVASLLYGLQPRDPITLTSSTVALIAIAAVAGWIPANRASRLDPARVLREG
jgi:putative ABC transport system permease protein